MTSLTDKNPSSGINTSRQNIALHRLVCTAARYVREEDGVVTMIDLEEIDLYAAAPGTTSARKIRASKKNVAKILARGQGIPSWKRSLAAKNKRLAGPEGNLSRRTVR